MKIPYNSHHDHQALYFLSSHSKFLNEKKSDSIGQAYKLWHRFMPCKLNKELWYLPGQSILITEQFCILSFFGFLKISPKQRGSGPEQQLLL